MMRRIMALFDEYQSKENAKHVTRALKENARQGFWNGALPPIGYRIAAAEQRGAKTKKKLEIDPLHADTIRLIYRLALEGEGDSGQMGVKAIVTYLNRKGIFTRDGGRWGIGQVHRVLTRRTYIGEHEWGKRSKHGDRRLLDVVTIRDAFNSKKQITFGKNGSTLTALASDGGAAHGLTPSFTLIDEIHAWRGRDLWEAIKSGQAKTDDTLMMIATTAGRGADGLAADQFAYAVQVAKGEIINPEFLPVLFMAEPDDDWQDEDVWRKVNPGLAHGFPSLSGLRALAKEAEGNPAELASFRQYNLNIWQANSRSPLFDLATYDARRFEDDEADLEALPAYVGVDMSQTGDLTAVAVAFRHADGQVTLRNRCFVPAADLEGRAHRDRAPYRQWDDEGLICLCPGGVIDQKQVEDHIRDLCARYDVQEIAVDPAHARVLLQNLSDEGLPVFVHPQSAVIMSEATGNLVRAVNGEMIRHDGDPVLRQHFDNVAVSTNPQSGLVRMHKQRSNGRIDAAVASAMAVSRAVTAHDKRSRYDDPEVLGLTVF
jgi:phage terminase large subunit-like protein